MKKKLVIYSCVALFFAAAFGKALYQYAHAPANSEGRETTVIILRGQGFAKTARMLADAGCIRRPAWFLAIARFTRADTQARAGEYSFSGAMSPLQILAMLKEGRTVRHKVTVVEGANMGDIALVVEKAGLCAARDFLAAARDTSLASRMGFGVRTFEGYLFPDTYFFQKDATPQDIIRAMTQRFRQVYGKQWENRARELGLTTSQVVTLASIIEKETGNGAERDKVASVFHNRLATGMRLQSDPTVIYGLSAFDGNITHKDLQAFTPYNTYKISGLPPGPIASPGAASLRAALFPAATRYLYFVSKNDGTHYFSTSLEEHNSAVRRFQLGARHSSQAQTRQNHAS